MEALFNNKKLKGSLDYTYDPETNEPISYQEEIDCSAKMKRRKTSKVNLTRLKELHPDIYDKLLNRAISKTNLFQFLLRDPRFNTPLGIEEFIAKVVIPKRTVAKFKEKTKSDNLKTNKELSLYFAGNEKDSADLIYQAKEMARHFLYFSNADTIKDICEKILLFSPIEHVDNFKNLSDQFKKLKSIYEGSFPVSGDTADLEAVSVLVIKEKLSLIRSNPMILQALHLRIYAQMLEDRLNDLLIEQTKNNEGTSTLEHGDYIYQIEWKVEHQIDIDKLREASSEIYEALIKIGITQKEINDFLRAEGFSSSEADIFMSSFVEDSGYGEDFYLKFYPNELANLHN